MIRSALESPRKMTKGKAKNYSSCLLYDTTAATLRLSGLSLAACNPNQDSGNVAPVDTRPVEDASSIVTKLDLCVSDKMSCHYCDAEFSQRSEQKSHYRSDWHRYNLKQRLKGQNSVTEEVFDEISENVSSISGSDSESETSDTEGISRQTSKPRGIPMYLRSRLDSETDSDSEASSVADKTRTATNYVKVFFRNNSAELVSMYRCVIYHKKNPPASNAEMITIATEAPKRMNWAIFMAGGGHFAAAIFKKDEMMVHKTFHRYVVRAKRGSAQSSRDSTGNAPKSAGASLRRYNEAALLQEVQELMASWTEHLKACDLIFLRAPSFNKRLFFGGKSPPLQKDDVRIRLIPCVTKRPTLNEVRRVHEVLASVECYGEAEAIQDFVPLSPPRLFSRETGHLEVIADETSPRQRSRRKVSPLTIKTSDSPDTGGGDKLQPINLANLSVTDEALGSSSAASTGSEMDLVEMQEVIDLLELKEFEVTKKPRRRKQKKRKDLEKHQLEPDKDVYAEEKYHLKNCLFTACKVGDAETLRNLLAIFQTPIQANVSEKRDPAGNTGKSSDTVEAISNGSYEYSDSVNIVGSNVNNSSNTDRENGIAKSIVCDSMEASLTVTGMEENGQESNKKNNERIANTKEPTDEFNLIHENTLDSVVNREGLMLPNLEKADPAAASSYLTKMGISLQELSPVVTVAMLNDAIGDNESTLLHVASKAGNGTIVSMLMEVGADPSSKDKIGQTPYTVANKETRNEFRRFMAKFPDKYDYALAQIPGPLTAEMETARKLKESERKKAVKKLQKERNKEKRAEEIKQKAEDREKQRFLSLSDREKRALAAERRILQQRAAQGITAAAPLSRCWQCGADISGKVPFEYYHFKFCTPKCLKAHKMATNQKS